MERFLAEARAGNREAENHLLRILRARFLSIAKRKVIGREEAEDVVQQACMTVLQKYKTEEFRGGFEAWAYTILRMKIGNYIQARKSKQKETLDISDTDRPTPSAVAEPDWNLERTLVACLRKIVKAYPQYARALNFSYQGYKTEEICSRMRITRSNLYSMLSRSRSMLRKCLESGKL